MAASAVAACLVVSFAGAVDPVPVAGTYEISICKGSCPATGDENVLVKGHLVLFPTQLTDRDVARLESLHVSSSHVDQPDGCFTLERLPGRTYRGYAGIDAAGLTNWSIESDELTFALYRSPDAGYKVTAQRSTTGFAGTGMSWGAGVAAPTAPGPEDVVARRIGDADMKHCEPRQKSTSLYR
jgi:hypothetical protein